MESALLWATLFLSGQSLKGLIHRKHADVKIISIPNPKKNNIFSSRLWKDLTALKSAIFNNCKSPCCQRSQNWQSWYLVDSQVKTQPAFSCMDWRAWGATAPVCSKHKSLLLPAITAAELRAARHSACGKCSGVGMCEEFVGASSLGKCLENIRHLV